MHSTFYPASTTKLLTSLLLVEDMQEGATITKSQDSLINVPSDSSHIGLKVGDSYSYTDGLHAILMGSDNFVSYDMSIFNASSINAFADKMNAKAKSLGANASHFVNPHGYHDPNHYTTPYDLALITSAA
ncbi:MAG: D-alanyl-D-alanine carboxypeptidase, partial [Niameybacter sp.]